MRRLAATIGGCVSAVALALGSHSTALAQPAATTGGNLTCNANEIVEIVVYWAGSRLVVQTGPNGNAGLTYGDYTFDGTLFLNASVIRTRYPAVRWFARVTGTNGFDPPDGPLIDADKTDQRCVAL